MAASVYVTELMGSETFVFLKLGRDRIEGGAGDFRARRTARFGSRWILRGRFFDPGSGIRCEVSTTRVSGWV